MLAPLYCFAVQSGEAIESALSSCLAYSLRVLQFSLSFFFLPAVLNIALMAGISAPLSAMSAAPIETFCCRSSTVSSLTFAFSATALVRCWHILLFFTGWAATVYFIDLRLHPVGIQPSLLTVLGIVLGFVISYRTTSSFERYNEGRRLWSQIILGTRTFSRLVWFHVPDTMDIGKTPEESKARVLLEKKAAINLLEAFAVSVKHYLRGEDGIHYQDLYHLVKHLPSYALPATVPSQLNVDEDDDKDMLTPLVEKPSRTSHDTRPRPSPISRNISRASFCTLPLPVTAPQLRQPAPAQTKPRLDLPIIIVTAPPLPPRKGSTHAQALTPHATTYTPHAVPYASSPRVAVKPDDEGLFPARMPPKYALFDFFPFSLLVRVLQKRGRELAGRKAARLRAQRRGMQGSHNIPLEISLYLSSYLAAMQQRKVLDAPISNALYASLLQLVDALTGLERILTTPIPFSYYRHLWDVTFIYCLVLPFQLVDTLQWAVIPGAAVVAFFFFGFLVAGDAIENPFSYDKNDLNMDHFTHNIIRNELRAITSTPAPPLTTWAFAASNDCVFRNAADERATPEEWARRGVGRMQTALAGF